MLKKLLTPTLVLALAASPAFAGSIGVSGTAPTVNDADIAMLITTGQFDVAPAGDGGHIWSNRPNQGQTFTTGSNALGYELSAVTLRNLSNDIDNNSATWTVRVGTVSGTNFTQVKSETSNNTISYDPGDYLTLSYNSTINLNPNTVYAFDWATDGSGFVAANNSDSNYAGGQAYSSGDEGTPDDANLAFRASDRVFHVDLATNTDNENGFGVNFIGGRSAADSNGIVGSVDLAGADKYAQRSWNEVAPRDGQNGSLGAGSVLDRQGNALATTTVTWAAPNTWSTSTAAPASDDHALMKGYLDSGNGGAIPTVTVSNVALDQYDVVVYIDGDGGAGSDKGQYWLEDGSGNVISNKAFLQEGHGGGGNFGGTYQEARAFANTTANADAGNYLVFRGLTTTDFVLVADQVDTSVTRAPINGFQVFGTDVESIAVNFQGGGSTPGATTAMQAEEIAGFVSQSHWNNAADNGAHPTNAGNQSGTVNDLTDSFGDSTDVDITWSVSNTWANTGLGEAGDRRLMDGYLDNFHGGSLTVSSIDYSLYDVIVYSNSDRPSGLAEFILNGTMSEFLTEGSTFDGILEEGVDYVIFRNVKGSSFTLTAAQSSGNPAAAVSGIQIISVPTPAALPAGLIAFAIIVGRRRRR